MTEDAKWAREFAQPSSKSVPDDIRIGIENRTCPEMLLYIVYRILRTFYVAFWFYVSPFLAMTIQFLIPLYVQYKDKK